MKPIIYCVTIYSYLWKEAEESDRFGVFSLSFGLMFPWSGVHQSEDMINGCGSDPCSYLLPSECVPFFDWHAQASLATVVKWKPDSRFVWIVPVCMCVCVCAVVRVLTVGVSLMWHHRRGHITVSDSPPRRGAAWVMTPPGLRGGRRWCFRRRTMRASVRVFVQQTERLHANAARRLVGLFGVWCCWFVVPHEGVYFLLW